MRLQLYKILNIAFSPFVALLMLCRYYIGKEDKIRIKERFGIASEKRPKGDLLWVHAASIGEMLSTMPLLNSLSENSNYKILLTSGTITSARLAQNKLPEKVIHQYAPIENYFVIKKFLNYWQPKFTIFTESEFWPCIISETSQVCKIISLNTRISDFSYRKWKIFNKFCKEILDKFSDFIPQSLDDKKKLKDLGAKKINYIGNLKYSTPDLPYNKNILNRFTNKVIGRKIVLFASTHQGEEELIIEMYQQLQDKDKSVLIIIVPRHPVRSNSITDLLAKYNVALRSKNEAITNSTEFYIVDTLGELGTFCRLSPITVMGGSFVNNIGGHNPIEPARLKSAVIMGPYGYNFKEICQDFKKTNSAVFVKNTNECVKAIKALWQNQKTYNKYIDNAIALTRSKENVLPNTVEHITQIINKENC